MEKGLIIMRTGRVINLADTCPVLQRMQKSRTYILNPWLCSDDTYCLFHTVMLYQSIILIFISSE